MSLHISRSPGLPATLPITYSWDPSLPRPPCRDPSRSKPAVMMHLKREDDHAKAMLRSAGGSPSLLRTMRREIEAAAWDAAVRQAAIAAAAEEWERAAAAAEEREQAGAASGGLGPSSSGSQKGGRSEDGEAPGMAAEAGEAGGNRGLPPHTVTGPDSDGERHVYFSRVPPPPGAPEAALRPLASERASGTMTSVNPRSVTSMRQHCLIPLAAWLGDAKQAMPALSDEAMTRVVVDEARRAASLLDSHTRINRPDDGAAARVGPSGGLLPFPPLSPLPPTRSSPSFPSSSSSRLTYHLHSLEPSPDGTLVAFTEGLLPRDDGGEAASDDGNERCDAAAAAWRLPEGCPSYAEGSEPPIQRYGPYTLHVLYAGSGRPAAPPVHRVQGPLVWSPDGRAVNFLASGGSQLWSLPISAAAAAEGDSGRTGAARAVPPTGFGAEAGSAGEEARLVFEDPQWLCMVFRRLEVPDGSCGSSSSSRGDRSGSSGSSGRSLITAQCLGSDMAAAQVLLLLPGVVETTSDAATAGVGCGGAAVMGAAGPGEAAEPRGGECWRWSAVMPPTRGSRLEMYPVSASSPSSWAPIDGTDPTATSEPADDLPSCRSMAAAAAPAPLLLLIRHWDMHHPLGRLLLLRLPIEGMAVSGVLAAEEAPPLGTLAAAAAATAGSSYDKPPPLPSLQPFQLLPSSPPAADGDADAGGAPKWQQRRRLVQVQVQGGRVLLVHEEMNCEELAVMQQAAAAMLGTPECSAAHGGTIDGTLCSTHVQPIPSATSGMVLGSGGFTEGPGPADDGRTLHVSLYRLVLSSGPRCTLLDYDDPGTCLRLLTHKTVVLPLPFVYLPPIHWRMVPSTSTSTSTSTRTGGLESSAVPQHAVQLQYSSLGAPPRSIDLVLREGGPVSAAGSAPLAFSSEGEPAVIAPPALVSSPYVHERLWAASSRDGVPIPLSLVYHKRSSSGGTGRPSGAAVLLQAYGAYGLPDNLDFQAGRSPLLDRGWVLAVAHVRGGGHLGPAWHEAGRGGHNKAAVSALDLEACAELLVRLGLAHPQRIALEASSAGAWAAVPALLLHRTRGGCSSPRFAAAVLTVPSLDPLSNMIASGYGWHELGCPLHRSVYEAVKGWSPMDRLPLLEAAGEEEEEEEEGHLRAAGTAEDAAASSAGGGLEGRRSGREPAAQPPPLRMLVRCGLFDNKAAYWEAAAFVAGARRIAPRGSVEAWLRVKAGGHECFGTEEDDAELCAFLQTALDDIPAC